MSRSRGTKCIQRSKAAAPVDLTRACLKRIESYNPALNAFITVTSEQALGAAREMEAEQRRGKWRGPLHGIPIALKDNIDTAGIRTTAASELFQMQAPKQFVFRAGLLPLGENGCVMKYRVYLEQDEDGVFVATCPALPGCVSQGRTRVEATENIRETIEGYIKSLKKHGEPAPPSILEEVVEAAGG